jgi:hypothetical protein
MITPAESRVLNLIAAHGKAKRVEPKGPAYSWTWQIAGTPKSGPVDSLIRKGFVQVTKDRSQAILSEKGKSYVPSVA